MGGIVNKVSGAFGFGGSSGYTANRADFQNPYSKKDRATDLSRADYYNRQAQGAFGGMNTAGTNINRNAAGYGGLISRLSNMGKGVGPSLAQMQLQQATNRNIQNQAGIAASNQGYNPAMAARLMGQNVAGMNQEAAGQSGQLRLQEQMDAMNQEIAARQAQGSTYGMAGNLYGNKANLGMVGGQRYQSMAQDQAENDRNAMIRYNELMARQGEGQSDKLGGFFSKLGEGLGSLVKKIPFEKIGDAASAAGNTGGSGYGSGSAGEGSSPLGDYNPSAGSSGGDAFALTRTYPKLKYKKY